MSTNYRRAGFIAAAALAGALNLAHADVPQDNGGGGAASNLCR